MKTIKQLAIALEKAEKDITARERDLQKRREARDALLRELASRIDRRPRESYTTGEIIDGGRR